MRKISIMLYPVKISRAINQETPEIMSAAEILSALTIKRLVVEQGRFLKRKQRVWKYLPSQTLKLQIVKVFYGLNF